MVKPPSASSPSPSLSSSSSAANGFVGSFSLDGSLDVEPVSSAFCLEWRARRAASCRRAREGGMLSGGGGGGGAEGGSRSLFMPDVAVVVDGVEM